MAGKKFARMREYIAAGAEGDELEGRFMRKFDELDMGGKPGTIGSAEIVKLAEQASRNLSNSERHVCYHLYIIYIYRKIASHHANSQI